jgi:hypothetical protein
MDLGTLPVPAPAGLGQSANLPVPAPAGFA